MAVIWYCGKQNWCHLYAHFYFLNNNSAYKKKRSGASSALHFQPSSTVHFHLVLLHRLRAFSMLRIMRIHARTNKQVQCAFWSSAGPLLPSQEPAISPRRQAEVQWRAHNGSSRQTPISHGCNLFLFMLPGCYYSCLLVCEAEWDRSTDSQGRGEKKNTVKVDCLKPRSPS